LPKQQNSPFNLQDRIQLAIDNRQWAIFEITKSRFS
jgi:hypothetical protein